MIRGIDVSHHNTVSDWSKLKDADISFCFIKASEGVSYRDPTFYPNWVRAKEAGIVRGAYHFFSPLQVGSEQAEQFFQVVGELEHGDLPPVIDMESKGNMPDDIYVEAAYDFLVSTEAWFCRTPMIYGSPSFLNSLRLDEKWAKFTLWVSHYGVDKPTIPSPWTTWSFWQSGQSDKIPGVDGSVDYNYYAGSMDQLNRFIQNSSVKGD